MRFTRVLLFIAVIAIFASLANAQDLGKIDPTLKSQIGAALAGYYDLKDALVDSDADRSSAKAQDVLTALKAIDTAKMTAAQKVYWDKIASGLKNNAEHISENNDLDHQREHFVKLSNFMYSLVFGFKANNAESYLQYCPMKKASWLSKSKDIRNPYYGSTMLECGSVKETLKKH